MRRRTLKYLKIRVNLCRQMAHSWCKWEDTYLITFNRLEWNISALLLCRSAHNNDSCSSIQAPNYRYIWMSRCHLFFAGWKIIVYSLFFLWRLSLIRTQICIYIFHCNNCKTIIPLDFTFNFELHLSWPSILPFLKMSLVLPLVYISSTIYCNVHSKAAIVRMHFIILK